MHTFGDWFFGFGLGLPIILHDKSRLEWMAGYERKWY